MPTHIQIPPASLTPWQMFLAADVVVQGVIVILLLASILTWTILLAKCLEWRTARRHLADGLRVARQRQGLAQLRQQTDAPSAATFAAVAMAEMEASLGLPPEGVKDRVSLGLRRLESCMIRRLAFGTGVLASVGSCGPFIGLFGTVWGIINSFIGISQAKTTNLAVVAPGIAEALLATACGLVAAIPAVLAYNLLARLLAGYRAGLGDLAAHVLTQASWEIDRDRGGGAEAMDRRSAVLRAAAE
jgi:biopolymer transport protein ExbB